jgi:membrane-associated phospholipid phosphatase
MQKIFSQVVSLIFHPLLVPGYAVSVLLHLPTHHFMVLPERYKFLIILLVFLSTFAMPALIFVILKKFNVLKSLEMHESRERVIPLAVVAVFFYATYTIIKQDDHNSILSLFMLGATMLVLLCLIVNYFTKISIHATSWGGFAGALAGFSLSFGVVVTPWFFVVILLAGLVGTARLILWAHTASQVYLGFGLGFITQMLLFYFI